METVITLEASGKLDRLREVLRERRPRPGDAVLSERAAFEGAAARMPVAQGVTRTAVDASGVPGEWLVPPGGDAVPRTILYFHGGGYVLGSVNTVRPLVSHLAVAASTNALSVEYRLAPEHSYPAAVDDGVAAYSWLLDAGTDPATVFVGGDSAGGGLTVAVMLALRDQGLPLPAGGFCLSPWVISRCPERRSTATPTATRRFSAGASPRWRSSTLGDKIPVLLWPHRSSPTSQASLRFGRAPRSGGNESVVVILSDGAGGQATSSLCAPSTSFGLSSCPVS